MGENKQQGVLSVLFLFTGGYGSSGSSQENINSKVYTAANYNTIMVEFENGNRYLESARPFEF